MVWHRQKSNISRKTLSGRMSIVTARLEFLAVHETYSDGKVRFSSVRSLFCLNHEPDHWFGSEIFLNLELNCQFRFKMVRFGFREVPNPEPNPKPFVRWCLIT